MTNSAMTNAILEGRIANNNVRIIENQQRILEEDDGIGGKEFMGGPPRLLVLSLPWRWGMASLG